MDYFVYRAAKEIGALAAVLGGIDGLVFTAGIGENSPEIRRRICEASAWLGVELDARSERQQRPADLAPAKQSLGLGDSDQRGTHDRPAHRRAAWTDRAALSCCRQTQKGELQWLSQPRSRSHQKNGLPHGTDSSRVSGRRRSTSATSSSRTTSRTTAMSHSSRPRPRARRNLWNRLNELFVEERKKGVLDVSQIPSSITAHAPGYIDRENEIIVGLQTDAPLKRAIMPNGGFRMVVTALKTYGYEPDPHVVETFTKYRKTHNDGVFDAYTADVRPCRSSHILTGLPDAYGRGRIIGDYRRVALYGVARLIERKQEEKHSLDSAMSTEEIIRDREELSEQIRALKELKQMAASYGFDISGPARTAREAVQWLYFAYLAAVKEQNGAAMSLGRTSTFLDIYFERDLAAGTLTEQQAQEIIDDFVIKLRIVRFLRTPEYDELFAGDPTWVTESIGGMGDDGRPLVTKTSFRFLQTLYNLGPAPEPNLTIWYSPQLPDGFRSFAAKVAIDTSSIQFESDEIMRRAWGDDGAIACCVSPMLMGKQMQFFGARANLAKCLLYAINGGRDEITGKQVGPTSARSQGEYARLRRRARQVREDDGLAGRRLRQRHERHPLHARQVRLRADRDGAARLRAAADDGVRHRRPVGGGRQPLGDHVTRRSGSIRDETGLDHRLSRPKATFPQVRQQRQSGRPARVLGRQHVHEQAAEVSRPIGTPCTRSRS